VQASEAASAVWRYAVAHGCLGTGGHASALTCDAALRELFGASLGRGEMRAILEHSHLTAAPVADARQCRPPLVRIPGGALVPSSMEPSAAGGRSGDSEAEWDASCTESDESDGEGKSEEDDEDEEVAPHTKKRALARPSSAPAAAPPEQSRRRRRELDSPDSDEVEDELQLSTESPGWPLERLPQLPQPHRRGLSVQASSAAALFDDLVVAAGTSSDGGDAPAAAPSASGAPPRPTAAAQQARVRVSAAPLASSSATAALPLVPGHLLHVQNLPPTMGKRRWTVPDSSDDDHDQDALPAARPSIPGLQTAPPRDVGSAQQCPHEFLCAITCEIMRDPVTCLSLFGSCGRRALPPMECNC
jgi:hypothetical protein